MSADENYYKLVTSLKERIKQARQKAVTIVNTELLTVYWEIGNIILQQQKSVGWGKKIISNLAKDLKSEFPDMKGFSERNLIYMQTFADSWPDFPFTQVMPAKKQPSDIQDVIITQAPLAQLSWYHHTTLLDKIKDKDQRLFYIQKVIENGWSRNVMLHQIESQLYLRQGQSINNFELTLPRGQSDLAKEALKNPYLFDFLGMGDAIQERELEKALIQHIKKFMLELGRGFAYVGNQYNLKVKDDDYFLDLLFFNFHLDCFVVFELKVGEFKPEYTGKLNFYINTIDEQVKAVQHKPTVGVLLCKTPNDTVVKFALKGINTPIGVAEYEFTNALPKQLKGEMPTVEELEMVVEEEVSIYRKPIEDKKLQLKLVLEKMIGDEMKKKKDKAVIFYLFGILLEIKKSTENLLKDQIALFEETKIEQIINNHSGMFTSADLEMKISKETVTHIGLTLYMDGFSKAGTKAFGIYKDLYFNLDKYKYTISNRKNEANREYLYDHVWGKEEIIQLAEHWCELIIDEIRNKLEDILKST